VPVHVVDFNDQQVLEAALVENIQRTDLNPIEKAQGFQEYLQRFQMTHDELAKRLSLDRTTVTNLVRLLDAPQEIQDAVRTGQISGSHARALLGATNPERQRALFKQVIMGGLSVRATEELVKGQKAEPAAPTSKAGEEKTPVEKTAHVKSIEDELRQALATRVEIRVRGKDRGQIILTFETNDDFERILEVLRGQRQD
jgi:ParB family chromosome partitioning protein